MIDDENKELHILGDLNCNMLTNISNQPTKTLKGPFIIYGGGWHRREMFFVAKMLLTQPLKKSKI
jgi:hypothetical protein